MTKLLLATVALGTALAGCSSDLGDGTPDPTANCVIVNNLTIRSDADLSKVPTSCFGVQGTFEISGTTMADLSAMGDLVAAAHLVIENNDGLRSLAGLDNVQVVGDLIIAGNPDLTSVDGLEATQRVNRLEITDNPALRTMTGLSNLVEVVGDAVIEGNSALADLRGLSRLQAVGGTLTLRDNAALTTLTGLDRLKAARGLVIESNSNLTGLAGARDLEVVVDLRVADNTRLASAAGLDPVEVGHLTIARNPAMSRIAGFTRLTRARGNVTFEDNDALTDLDGFSGQFLAVTGVLTVRGNANLTQTTALGYVKAIGAGLIVVDNPKLSQCRAAAIRSRIPSIGGGIEIRNNSTAYNPC